jgi:hypothetical protein
VKRPEAILSVPANEESDAEYNEIGPGFENIRQHVEIYPVC